VKVFNEATPMRHLHWFRTDLRLNDNMALASHAAADSLLCLYLMPKPKPWCNITGIGPQRERFLRESLAELKQSLEALGQNLLVLEGSPELVIPHLVERYGITEMSVSDHPGWEEKQSITYLTEKLTIPVQVHRGNTLFTEHDLPMTLDALPTVFSPFRRRVEKLAVRGPREAPEQLPPPPSAQFDAIPISVNKPHPGLPLPGGRRAGLRRMRQFIWDDEAITEYKLTRNCLDGFSGSSTFSPWLANGSLSVREVAHTIFDFEKARIANESTYWLFFELLWREFFYWRAEVDGKALFMLSGVTGKPRRSPFEPRNFARWCAGDTNFPLVNALMRQLVATGWMSNRGRQIAASCLINEFDGDWRFGAAFLKST
jgi:deoxyribodipyrimidine photo-lyase